MKDIDKIKEIVLKFFDVDNITEDFSLKEAQISSIIIIKILVEIEKVFDIEVPDEMLELSSFDTVKDIYKLVQRVKEN